VALLRGALDVAASFNRPVSDALYLALAVEQSGQLVSADERLVNALQGTRLAASITLLGT
jgi:predicted nucleic acid-binding protein